jgi:hypothetical protein
MVAATIAVMNPVRMTISDGVCGHCRESGPRRDCDGEARHPQDRTPPRNHTCPGSRQPMLRRIMLWLRSAMVVSPHRPVRQGWPDIMTDQRPAPTSPAAPQDAMTAWHAATADAALSALGTGPGGLSVAEAAIRLEAYGPNA